MLDVGARIKKKETPKKPTVGHRHNAQKLAATKLNITMLGKTTPTTESATGQL